MMCSWLISITIMFSVSVHIFTNDRTSSYVYNYHIVFSPFICRWALNLIAYLCCYEWCWDEHESQEIAPVSRF